MFTTPCFFGKKVKDTFDEVLKALTKDRNIGMISQYTIRVPRIGSSTRN